MKKIKCHAKKSIILATLYISLTFPAHATTGKTFFMPRAISGQRILYSVPNTGPALASTTFYQQSNSNEGLARYFFPNDKTELVIAQDGSGDINSGWFFIGDIQTSPPLENPFSSTIKIRPESKSYGTMLRYDAPVYKSMWFSCQLPFVQVENNLHFTESNIKNGLTRDALDSSGDHLIGEYTLNSINATEAFNNRLMLYGKMKDGVQKLAGLADINVQLGLTCIDDNVKKIQFWLQGIIPTGYKPRAEYVFEPIVGNGHHVGLGGGGSVEGTLYKKNSLNIKLSNMFNYIYLLKNTEKRTFDLVRGPWSRYTWAFQRYNDQNYSIFDQAFGPNHFTQDFYITPGSVIDDTIALHLHYKSFHCDSGYSIYMKREEEVEYKPHPLNLFITQKIETIKTTPSTDLLIPNVILPGYQFNPCDIDADSVTQPKVVSHTFFLTLGWTSNNVTVRLGGSYEYEADNNALHQWTVFSNLSVHI